MFPTPLGRSSLSQSLLLPWQPLSSPRRGLGWFGSAVPPWDVSCAAAGQWRRSKGQPEELGARYSPFAACRAGWQSWGEKGQKGVITQPAQGIWLGPCPWDENWGCWHRRHLPRWCLCCPGGSAGQPPAAAGSDPLDFALLPGGSAHLGEEKPGALAGPLFSPWRMAGVLLKS